MAFGDGAVTYICSERFVREECSVTALLGKSMFMFLSILEVYWKNSLKKNIQNLTNK